MSTLHNVGSLIHLQLDVIPLLMSCLITAGLLFCDMAEITFGSEGNTDNGGEAVEARVEGDSDNELQIKLPYAGADLTVHLLFSPHEPWMTPEMTFSDAQFSSIITSKDLIEQVLIHNHFDVQH